MQDERLPPSFPAQTRPKYQIHSYTRETHPVIVLSLLASELLPNTCVSGSATVLMRSSTRDEQGPRRECFETHATGVSWI